MNIQKVCLGACGSFRLPELLGIPGRPLPLAQTADDGWRWSITPYLWGSGIQADVTFPAGQEIGTDARFRRHPGQARFRRSRPTSRVTAKSGGSSIDATYLSMSDDGSPRPDRNGRRIRHGNLRVCSGFYAGRCERPVQRFCWRADHRSRVWI